MLLSPDQYASATVFELLRAAALGHAGVDRRWLRAIIDHGPTAAPEILRFYTDEREDDRLEISHVLLDIARLLRTPAAIPFLVEFARRHEFDFEDELTSAFVELGAASLEPLLDLQRQEPEAHDVTFTLAALGVSDPRILEALEHELATEPYDAAISLGTYGNPAAIPALRQALARIEGSGQEHLERELQRTIEELQAERRPEEPVDPSAIWNEYPETEEPYFAALEEAELLAFLESPVPEYRARAIQALNAEEMSEQAGKRVFELAREDTDVRVRAQGWEALEGSADRPEVRAALQARVADPQAPLVERGGALVALAQYAAEDDALSRTILDFYERPEARARALQAMWHSGDRRFGEIMPRHLDDPDPAIKRQAIWGVAFLGVSSQAGRIERMFADEQLREVALYAYAMTAPSEVSPARMRRLLRKIDELSGGLSEDEADLVRRALDARLEMNGQPPVFFEDHGAAEEQSEAAQPVPKVGRNDPCPCGSGKKYKKCHGQ